MLNGSEEGGLGAAFFLRTGPFDTNIGIHGQDTKVCADMESKVCVGKTRYCTYFAF